MTQTGSIEPRAGAGLPPALAWGPCAARSAAWAALAAACLAGAPARAAAPSFADSARWGWGMRPDSAAVPAVPAVPAAPVVPVSPGAAPAAPVPPGTAAPSEAAPPAREAGEPVPFEYLWVVRTAILTPEGVDQVIARARSGRVRGLLVQVVGRGDAFYRSDHLPRSEALPGGAFDPLDRLVRAAHAESIEVHAWINCMLVWSAPQPPRDPRHVLHTHPEWIARLRDGRALHRLTPRQREALGLEGVFLAPAHPGVREWVARTAAEVVSRYPVDGIHLDYIRQPTVAVGWDPTTRARFALEAGVDPARFDRLQGTERTRVDSLWRSFQGEQVRAVVATVRDSVHARRPGLPVSAAVIADTLTAERHNAQRWRDWLRTGLLDRVYVMCYAQPVQTVMDQLLAVVNSLGAGGRVVPGIAVYNTPPGTAAAKIKGARALGFPALAVYSYDALEARPGYWDRLRELLFAGP